MNMRLSAPLKTSLIAGVGIIAAITLASIARATVIEAASVQPAGTTKVQTCPLITPETASHLLGAPAKLNQIIAGQPTSAQQVSSISCVFTQIDQESAEPLVVGKRTALDAQAADMLEAGFFTNRLPGEKSFTIDGYDGFVYEHDGTVELRLWAGVKWYDIHAPTVDMAERAAKVMIQ